MIEFLTHLLELNSLVEHIKKISLKEVKFTLIIFVFPGLV